MFIITGKYTNAYVMIDHLDSVTISQIQNFVNDKSFRKHVAIMPDSHAGKGSVIGFTMPVDLDHVIPNTVGVDVGCGMFTFPFPFNMNHNKRDLDKFIRDRIPMATKIHNKAKGNLRSVFDEAKNIADGEEVNKMFPGIRHVFYNDFNDFVYEMDNRGINLHRAELSIGTLGGGNHFIEIGISDADGKIYCTIHCGSRNFGLQITNYWQNIAKKVAKKFDEREFNKRVAETIATIKDKRDIPDAIKEIKEEIRKEVPVKGLEYLYGNYALGYLCDMIIAQTYASINRKTIASLISPCFNEYYGPDIIETVHNFISFHDGVIRKGAISAHEGETVVIPFNSAYGILVCKGKGNKEWNYSAPHGAGRLYARGEAKRKLKMDKFKSDMAGIYSTSVTKKNLDESPAAYKDPEIVVNAIEPTVDIVDRIRPIINIKA